MSDAVQNRGLLTPLEYYNLIRSRIEHEDNLVMQRLSWLVASQAFLFSAYAITLNGLSSATQPALQNFMAQERRLYSLIPIVAILTCALIYASILAAAKAIAALRNSYRSRFSQEERNLPDIMASPSTRRLGLSAPILLPLVFMIVWFSLWLHGLR